MSEYIIEWSGIGARIVELIGSVHPCLIVKRLREERRREEIVRCRDCKHYRPHEFVLITDIEHVCLFWAEGVKVAPDGYCAWGERRDE